ncbi:hypothetical protein MYP_3336 [Sporocytophaga myxococcoides]|uniref:Uncharacterized protein n=1 Tax=Sporocytophaga myxococcoides TaxID=153721 RepID=A0A098LI35_9BACT|nr:hypothetical protein [Sporocytophaga myxococcoides]GAL86107.1 hypothetical protein MYP_3336 [Sporocytophaga myxococcoides]
MRKLGYKLLTYKAASFLLKILKPKSFGARAMLMKDNEVLLVKHTYQTSWYFSWWCIKKRGAIHTKMLSKEN